MCRLVVWMYKMSKRIGYCMTMRGAARHVSLIRTIGKIDKMPHIICTLFFLHQYVYIHENSDYNLIPITNSNNHFLLLFLHRLKLRGRAEFFESHVWKLINEKNKNKQEKNSKKMEISSSLYIWWNFLHHYIFSQINNTEYHDLESRFNI